MKEISDKLWGHERGDDIELNEMLSVEIRGGGELWFHVDDVRDFGLAEKIGMLRDGFQKLAGLLRNNYFGEIDIISGASWIITKNPGLIRRLGFTIDNEAEGAPSAISNYKSKAATRNRDKAFDDIEPSYAYISKDKFLELYGEQVHI